MNFPTFTVIDRTLTLTVNQNQTQSFELGQLKDIGFLSLSTDRTLAVFIRAFITPDQQFLVADIRQQATTPVQAFEQLWQAHFRRNFAIVGIREADYQEFSRLAETVFFQCFQQVAQLTQAAKSGRSLQKGYFEPTNDGLRWVEPQSAQPVVPPLKLVPVSHMAIDQQGSQLSQLISKNGFGVEASLLARQPELAGFVEDTNWNDHPVWSSICGALALAEKMEGKQPAAGESLNAKLSSVFSAGVRWSPGES